MKDFDLMPQENFDPFSIPTPVMLHKAEHSGEFETAGCVGGINLR